MPRVMLVNRSNAILTCSVTPNCIVGSHASRQTSILATSIFFIGAPVPLGALRVPGKQAPWGEIVTPALPWGKM